MESDVYPLLSSTKSGDGQQDRRSTGFYPLSIPFHTVPQTSVQAGVLSCAAVSERLGRCRVYQREKQTHCKELVGSDSEAVREGRTG